MKPLYLPQQLRFLTALHARKELSSDQLHHLHAMKKGIVGETQWTAYLNQLPNDIPILYDLNLEMNQTVFQIDALCILQHKMILFEIKNYSGNYSIADDKWLSPNKKEMKDPLLQIKRNELLIHQFFKKHQLPIPFDYYLIFVHPEFVLYGATADQNVILPGQISAFLTTLKNQTVTPTGLHTKIIDTLLTHHKNKLTMLVKPEYHYEELEKGVFCSGCCGRMERVSLRLFQCTKCNQANTLEKVILEMIAHFKILFPQRKITMPQIANWCGDEISTDTITRVLQRNFIQYGKGRGTYYE